MSHEPNTRQLRPAQLAEFLRQLGDTPVGQPDESAEPRATRRLASRGQRPLAPPAHARHAEPPTMLGSGHAIEIGLPRLRARKRFRLAAMSPLALRRELQRMRRPGAAERVILRLTRPRPWRLAFVIAALLSLALLAGLALHRAPSRVSAREIARPPPPPQALRERLACPAVTTPREEEEGGVDDAAPARAALRSTAGAGSERAAMANVSSAGPQHAASSAASPVTGEGATRAPARPAHADIAADASAARPPAAQREAVDLLLSGRNRAALDAYRALLSSSASHARSPALRHVVRLLEREQAACVLQGGAACGL